MGYEILDCGDNYELDLDDLRQTFICDDCLAIMRRMPAESIDLIVTSPPYNIRNSASGGKMCGGPLWKNPLLRESYDGYDDKMPYDEYITWQRECLSEMMRIIKDDGAIFYNHKWRIQNLVLQDRHEILQGFPVRQIIIWHRAGGYNFNSAFFLPTYEVIYLIAKSGYRLVKGASRLSDVWKMKQEQWSDHPAPFPVELPKRAISSSQCMDREGAVVLDPFSGSGTTAVAAVMLGKDFIGIEKSPKYCEMAQARVMDITPSLDF